MTLGVSEVHPMAIQLIIQLPLCAPVAGALHGVPPALGKVFYQRDGDAL